MTLAVVTISNVAIQDATHMQAQVDVSTTWGHALSDIIVADLSALTPAQVITAIKNKVVTWAATQNGGSQIIAVGSVWVFGGPQ